MLRNILRETVCMRLLIAFCIGIIMYHLFSNYLTLGIIISCYISLTTVTFYYVYFLVNKYNFTFKLHNGILVFSICGIFSFLITYTHDDRNFNGYAQLIKENKHLIEITNNGKKTANNCLYEIKILSEKYDGVNSILSIRDTMLRFGYGDKLIINDRIKPIDFINHPGQFNYKQYLKNKHIYHRFQTDTTNLKLILKGNNRSLLAYSNQQRSKLLSILKLNIQDKDSYEMAAALLLGERSELDQELLKSYSNTGTIHIISVSGLHVGIIFIVLQYLFNKTPFLKNKVINSIAIITCIWFYALLTGLPASVIRSALMISFASIGKTMSSKSNSINHVAASAIVILSYNTNYLFDIGFQLSYLAVLGIMYLQKPISELYFPSSKLGTYIWETTSVSVAAQLFTLPLCWYYFHQFPNYFLIANLLAIPLSSIALYACIANVIFAYVPYLNKVCEWIVVYSIKWMNTYLMWISDWPFAVSQLKVIDVFEVIIISFILFFLLLYWKEQIKRSLKYLITCLILYSLYGIYIQQKHIHNHLWIIPQGRNSIYTLETRDKLMHFYPSKFKTSTINNQLKSWRTMNNKQNKIIFVNQSQYALTIDSITYLSKSKQGNHLSNNYNRICLK